MTQEKPKQPTGITDIDRFPLYERVTGEEVHGKTIGFNGVRTVDGRTIGWKDLFYEKEDAIKNNK